ncbi:hypothetical protein ABZ379_10475 [Streptomyces canus]|uniref:hypothetical protein n=1 Tax=Streptomyces canus TaxID=58343 RepID=UPI00340F1B5A
MIIPAQPGWVVVMEDEDRDTVDEACYPVIAWKESEGGRETFLCPVVAFEEQPPSSIDVDDHGFLPDGWSVVFRDPEAATPLAITLHKAACGGPMSRDDLKKALSPLHRHLFEAALHEAVTRQWITRHEDKYVAGPKYAPKSWPND